MVKDILANKWEVGASHYAKGSTAVNENLWKEILEDIYLADKKLEVLDVGTGPGVVAIILAELGHNVTGLDLSQSMLDIAKDIATQRGIHCNFVRGDAEALPFDNESFDLVTNRLNLWTLPNPGKGVYHWVRVLKPGGKLAVFVNDVKNPYEQTKELKNEDSKQQHIFSKEYYDTFQHLPFARALPSQVKALLEAAGLRDVTVKPIKDERRYTVEQLIDFLRTKNVDESKITSLLDNKLNEELLQETFESLNLVDTLFKKLDSGQEFAIVRHMVGVIGVKG
ncbi:class I SAM-dependent methyltransferase [Bacillus sp. DJP31]|uniref:class I SAM-dependent methyltransferase n=1 Tax=Bacillus sp. DJP31 TaxID=3409789 RepID=UPI003BB6FA4E